MLLSMGDIFLSVFIERKLVHSPDAGELALPKKLRFGKFRFDLGIYKRIIPGGLSDGITELSTGVSAFVFNRAIVRVIGDQGLVAFSVITYVNTVIVMTMTGISQGLQPLVSFYYGKKEEKNYKTLLKYAFTAQVIISLAAFLGVFFLPPAAWGFLSREAIRNFLSTVFRLSSSMGQCFCSLEPILCWQDILPQ